MLSILIGIFIGIEFSVWLYSIAIFSYEDFIHETRRLSIFIEQVKAVFHDGQLRCPFDPAHKGKYTPFGFVFLSILWILTFGVMLIPTLITVFIYWYLYWLYIKLCIKQPKEDN